MVVDSPTSINISYFNRLFANSMYDCRVVTTREELTPLLENLHFLYIFVGDFEDMSWLPSYRYGEMGYIVFYSQNEELIKKQRQYAHECSVVPIGMMNRFLTEMGVINATPVSINPTLLF